MMSLVSMCSRLSSRWTTCSWGAKRGMRQATLERYVSREAKKITLNRLLKMGRELTPAALLENGRYVHEELPVRLAHRIVDIQRLPYFAVHGALKHVYELYVDAFDAVTNIPFIRNEQEDDEFTKLLLKLVAESIHLVDNLALGLREVQRRAAALNTEIDLESFINQLLMSRIGRRVLAEQHIRLHQPPTALDTYVGVIDTQCSPHQCLEKSAGEASRICKERYGVSPEVVIHGDSPKISYIPHHLEYIMLEIIKNAMRATVEKHVGDSKESSMLPEIHALVAEGERFVTVRITDRGGGIPADIIDYVFRYGFTTSPERLSARSMHQHTVMAGFGFGLPLSRLYANYFGGDLQLVSMDGYGTDVYVRLDRTGDVLETVEI